jgi:hypothetical protein
MFIIKDQNMSSGNRLRNISTLWLPLQQERKESQSPSWSVSVKKGPSFGVVIANLKIKNSEKYAIRTNSHLKTAIDVVPEALCIMKYVSANVKYQK